MSKRVISQATPANNMAGMASNPANGMQNMLLSGGASGAGNAMAGADGMLSPEELIRALDAVSKCKATEVQKHQCNIESLIQRSQNENVRQKLMHILGAMQVNADPGKRSKDPITGKPDPTADQLARELVEEIREMTKNSSASGNGGATPQQATASTVSFNLRRMAAKGKGKGGEHGGKKKTRGNPFRVLMGKVGKLLDHGLEKRDIVRYVLRDKIWNEETIGKAVDIVRDYNRKKHKSGEDDKPKKDKGEKTASTRVAVTESDERGEQFNRNIDFRIHGDPMDHSDNVQPGEQKGSRVHEVDPPLAPCVPAEKDQRKSSNAFNLRRFAEKTGIEVYDVKPDFSKRSTSELMARAAWLQSLQDYNEDTPQGDGRKAADKSGATAELKSIRAALKARGFSDSEIS